LWGTLWHYAKCTGVAVDESGNVFFSGDMLGPTDLDPTTGVDTRTSNGLNDIFFGMLGTDRSYQWGITFGSADDETSGCVAVDSSGAPYLVGSFANTIDFNPGADTDERTSDGLTDAFLASYDTAGNLVWARTWGGLAADRARDVAVASTGEIFVVGDFSGTVNFHPGIGSDVHTSNGDTDCFLVRFLPDGEW
jgi:hypothetical protein